MFKGQAQDARLLGKSLGVSYLRLLPKLSNIRAVVNMGRKQEVSNAVSCNCLCFTMYLIM